MAVILPLRRNTKRVNTASTTPIMIASRTRVADTITRSLEPYPFDGCTLGGI